MSNFEELNIDDRLIQGLYNLGYREPFPIQEKAIPSIMKGNDIIGQAKTGSGKTLAFALPMLDKLNPRKSMVQGLILVPTRELALQVTTVFKSLTRFAGFRVVSVYGGQPIFPQIEALRKGVQIVVGTPGRIIDHIKRGTMSLHEVSMLVLDEADRMLDMGFIDDISFILSQAPRNRQTMLFSATMPPEVVRLAKRYMRNPDNVFVNKEEIADENIDQTYCQVTPREKFEVLCSLLRDVSISKALIFCRMKIEADRLADDLYYEGFDAARLHGDLSQNRREQEIERFKNGSVKILVATDVAARGLDIDNISHVINYNVPEDPLVYFHRIGRSARAGKSGSSITLVTKTDFATFNAICGMTKVNIREIQP